MMIALVHDFLNQWGGAERVLDSLHELYPEAPVFTLMHDKEKTKGHFDQWTITTSFLQHKYIAKFRKYALPLYPIAIESFDFTGYDVVISSSNSFAKGIITGSDTLHICYCHTPTAYLWSWTHQYLSEQKLNRLTGFVTRSLLHNLRIWDRVSANRVDVWVANSKNVGERIKKFYRQDSTVIYPPVDINRFKIHQKIEDYFLYIGRLSGYKRPGLVVDAFNELKLPLVIVGDGDERPNLDKRAHNNIRFTGWLSDEEAAKFISQARAVIFPVEEDFGIVPVEAMAAGRPVIAYGKGGALETVVEDKSGIFFDEPSKDSLIDAVRRFEKREHAFDPISIRQHAQQFDRQVFLARMSQFVDKEYSRFKSENG